MHFNRVRPELVCTFPVFSGVDFHGFSEVLVNFEGGGGPFSFSRMMPGSATKHYKITGFGSVGSWVGLSPLHSDPRIPSSWPAQRCNARCNKPGWTLFHPTNESQAAHGIICHTCSLLKDFMFVISDNIFFFSQSIVCMYRKWGEHDTRHTTCWGRRGQGCGGKRGSWVNWGEITSCLSGYVTA